jgi:hypothetical protein
VECEIDYAWAAGFIDGEGHIGTRLNTSNTYQISIQVHQKGTEPLDRLQKIFGGKVYTQHSKPGIYKWSIQKRQLVLDTIDKLWPYLTEVKRAQATKAREAASYGV